MVITIGRDSRNCIKIETLYNKFELLANSFEAKRYYPGEIESYKRVIQIKFRWLRWRFEILLRKSRKTTK